MEVGYADQVARVLTAPWAEPQLNTDKEFRGKEQESKNKSQRLAESGSSTITALTTSPGMASRPASAAGEVTFETLRAWVAEQEEYLQKHGWMAPLTDEQRCAISVLVARPASPAPADDDDDLGSTDWISLLMRRSTRAQLAAQV